MNNWKVILATMLIFGTGVVTGGLLVHHSERARFRPPFQIQNRSASISNAGGARLDFLRRVQRELNLTAEQREKVDKLLRESQERTRKLMEPIAPQLREEVHRTKEHFRDVLTPDQQARFDELMKHQEQARESRRNPRGKGPAITNQPSYPATNQ